MITLRTVTIAAALGCATTFSLVAVAETVAGTAGPYAVVMEHDAAHPEHTIYRPTDLTNLKGKLPFIAFGNGGCLNIGNLERRFLAEVASHGYIVAVPGKIEPLPENFGPTNTGGLVPTQAKPGHMLRAIDWAIAQSKRGAYAGRLDPDRIAVAGASCGGLEAIAAGADTRVDTVVILNSGILRGGLPASSGGAPRPAMQLPATEADLAKLHTPVIYLVGGPKDIAFSGSEADFAQIQGVPLFNANIDVGHAGTLGQPHGGAMGAAVIAWLNWQLKGDTDGRRQFAGADCGLCKDPAWTVKKKNLP